MHSVVCERVRVRNVYAPLSDCKAVRRNYTPECVSLLVSLQLDLLSEHYETARHDLADEQAATSGEPVEVPGAPASHHARRSVRM